MTLRQSMLIAGGLVAAALVWLPVRDGEGRSDGEGPAPRLVSRVDAVQRADHLAERPLFSAERRPYEAAAGEAETPPEVETPRIDGRVPALRGLIRTARTTIVIFETMSNRRFHRVAIGKAAAGWEVAGVDAAGVVTVRNVETREVRTMRFGSF